MPRAIITKNGKVQRLASGKLAAPASPSECECCGEAGCCSCGRPCDFSRARYFLTPFNRLNAEYTIFESAAPGVPALRWNWADAIGVSSGSQVLATDLACDEMTIKRPVAYLGRAQDEIGSHIDVPTLPDGIFYDPGTAPPVDPGLPELPDPGGTIGADALAASALLYDPNTGAWSIEIAIRLAYNIAGAEARIVITGDILPSTEGPRCIPDPDSTIDLTAKLYLGTLAFDVPVSASTASSADGTRFRLTYGVPGSATYSSALVGGSPQVTLILYPSSIDFGLTGIASCPETDPSMPADCCDDIDPGDCVLGQCADGPVGVDFRVSFTVSEGGSNGDSSYQTHNTMVFSGRATSLDESCFIARARSDSQIPSSNIGTIRCDAQISESSNDPDRSSFSVGTTFLGPVFEVSVGIQPGEYVTISCLADAFSVGTTVNESGTTTLPAFYQFLSRLFVTIRNDGTVIVINNDRPLCQFCIPGFVPGPECLHCPTSQGEYHFADWDVVATGSASVECPGSARGVYRLSETGFNPTFFPNATSTVSVSVAINGLSGCTGIPSAATRSLPVPGCGSCGDGLEGEPA